MKLIHFTDAKPIAITEDTAENITGRLVISKADKAKYISMRVFELAKNGLTPWYFLDWDHEIFVHSGRGEILYNNTWVPLAEGYVIHIPENEEHQIRNTGNQPLVIISLVPPEAPEL